MVDLSVSDAVNPGASLCTITKCLLKKLEDSNPTIPVVEAMQQEHNLRVVDGRELFVTEKTCQVDVAVHTGWGCLLYTSPSPRDRQKSRMPSSA